MWKTIAFVAVKIGLGILSSKSGKTINTINQIANVALPIVESISEMTYENDYKFDLACEQVKSTFNNSDNIKDHMIESGVQLAYSLFKGKG